MNKSLRRIFHSILSPLIALIICIIILIFFSNNPFDSIKNLFFGTFNSSYYFGMMLNTQSLLMIASLGAAITNKNNTMNLGGEGQIYLGAFITCIILNLNLNIPVFFQILIALVASVFSGIFLTSISAILKEKKSAKILLTSFLISACIIPIIDGLILLFKSNTNQNLLALPYIEPKFRLKQILPPSQFNISFFIGIILCLIIWAFFKFTYAGRKISIWGKSPEFAKYAGFSSIKNTFLTLSFSGALHSLAGFFAVTGTYYTCHKGFALGMGWNALSCALISKSNPILIIPYSFILAWLYTSTDRISLTQNFTFDLSTIIQGVILFTIAIPLKKEDLK